MLESAKSYSVWDLGFASVAFPISLTSTFGDFEGNDKRKATCNHNEKINQQYNIVTAIEVKNASYEKLLFVQCSAAKKQQYFLSSTYIV